MGKQEEEELRIYLTYSETRTGGELCEGEKDEPYACREPYYIELTLEGLFRSQPEEFFYHSYKVTEDYMKCKDLFVVVIRYTDGDSFGSVCGNYHFAGLAKTREEAKEIIQLILYHPATHKPWEGYFSNFEEAEIHKMELQ